MTEEDGLKRKHKALAGACMLFGVLLVGSALALALYNHWDEQRAADAVEPLLEQLRPESVTAAPVEEEQPLETAAPVPSLAPEEHMPAVTPAPLTEEDTEVVPELATETVDGVAYIGILTIPSLGLELPVSSECSDANLKNSPCRYAGGMENLVIAGHNYICHFGYLGRLRPGDQVRFTNVEGQVYDYQVEILETLSPSDVEEMTSGEWPLTLFTCTMGRQYRVTVRCSRV